jgi:hypothetical protein
MLIREPKSRDTPRLLRVDDFEIELPHELWEEFVQFNLSK